MSDCNLVVKDGVPMVTSKQLADAFGKTHRNVMRDIHNTLRHVSDDFRVLNFEQSEYKSLQNKTLPCISMTRDGFSLIAMGFSGKDAIQWKEKYINAFNAMEAALLRKTSLMTQFGEAVKRMEEDKEDASNFGRGLALWKKTKLEHETKIASIEEKLQMLLPFQE